MFYSVFAIDIVDKIYNVINDIQNGIITFFSFLSSFVRVVITAIGIPFYSLNVLFGSSSTSYFHNAPTIILSVVSILFGIALIKYIASIKV